MPANQHDELAVRGSDKRLSDSWPHSFEILFTDHVILYYMTGLCRPLSGICYITGRRRKGKSLEVPYRV